MNICKIFCRKRILLSLQVCLTMFYGYMIRYNMFVSKCFFCLVEIQERKTLFNSPFWSLCNLYVEKCALNFQQTFCGLFMTTLKLWLELLHLLMTTSDLWLKILHLLMTTLDLCKEIIHMLMRTLDL